MAVETLFPVAILIRYFLDGFRAGFYLDPAYVAGVIVAGCPQWPVEAHKKPCYGTIRRLRVKGIVAEAQH